MSNVEIKNTMINFWQNAINEFYLTNYGLTKEELIKQKTIEEIRDCGKLFGIEKCERQAVRSVESLIGCSVSKSKWGSERIWLANNEDQWKKAIRKIRKESMSNFSFSGEKVTFSVNSFECVANIRLAPVMLKKWKSYKIN